MPIKPKPHRPAHAVTPVHGTFEQLRGSRQERGYDERWVKASKRFLATHPFCALCWTLLGILTASALTDHWVPHKGDQFLFWDETNWCPMCWACHSGPKQAMERAGTPTRANHPSAPKPQAGMLSA